jgi:hypothetical protein
MEFILTYEGPLKANGTVTDKQAIRRQVHRQLSTLWGQLPLRNHREYLKETSSVSIIRRLGDFRFAPLVSERLSLVAELSVTFLRPEPPGSIITQGGDIDNRLKTLLDALRMPKVAAEIPPGDSPAEQEDPFFCLLEDDNLVTGLSVTTDRLLDLNRVTGSTHTGSEVLLLIHVETKRTIYAV